jgi:solute carrier family 25 (mitochondrial S-adenosylmethionine transporter), member 26
VTWTDRALYVKLFDGLIPSLIGGVPAGAIFFGTKDFCKTVLKESLPLLSRQEITIISVVLANLPYWLIRTPSEILKTRDQTTGRSSLRELVADPRLFANSFFSNLIYALPADIIKFLACKRQQQRIIHHKS